MIDRAVPGRAIGHLVWIGLGMGDELLERFGLDARADDQQKRRHRDGRDLFEISPSAVLRERFDTLSSREREIMIKATAGQLNKQIANDTGIAESTVKVHRSNLMRKMKARSLPELSRMGDMLKLTL